FLGKTPMKVAVGTSLFIIALQSLFGFLGDIRPDQVIDWKVVLLFTFFSIIGIFIGNRLSKTINGSKLKAGFGWFVLVMGVYIMIKELVL
ncbi:MAG: sulfite exporter TauE/SafE family protein, partial [Flavobacterium sp.]|nr:sulfite exporter TauE/SafE family protein [Flavobacterium sp.]